MKEQLELFNEEEDIFVDLPNEDYFIDEDSLIYLQALEEEQKMYIPIYWQDITPDSKFRIYKLLEANMPFPEFDTTASRSSDPICFTSHYTFAREVE